MRKFQISNFKFQISGNEVAMGFSLIELIVVVAILGGLAVATSRIFFANLRGTEKTQRLIELRQAGDQAMLAMKKKIRLARKVNSSCPLVGVPASSIEIVRRDPQATSFASAESITTQFSCEVEGSVNRMRMIEDTIDTYLTPASLSIIPDCSAVFICEKATGTPAIVTIEYTLQNNDGETMNFISKVSLRNY